MGILKKLFIKFFGKIGYLLENDITMGQQIILSENEKLNIQKMYGLINEQNPSGKYKAGGTKFCFYGSCRVDIKVIDTETSQIVTSKGAEGKDVKVLYSQVIKLIQDELKKKNITDVTLPTLDKLEDTSP